MTTTFAKLPKSNEELADLLIERNLCADRQETIHLLNSIGYYRLSGYLVPFKVIGTDAYRDGATLQTVWELYTFDRHLRLLAMDALARIEIAIRALIVRHHTARNPDPFAYTQQANLPKLTKTQHAALLQHIADSIKNAKEEPDIRHLTAKYGISDYPPVWTMMEHVPMGSVTYYYEGLPDTVQQDIANTFFVRPSAFSAFLMTLKNARNVCAHHSRLWNRHMKARISKKIGKAAELQPFCECFNAQTNFTYTTTFTLLSLCAYCMNIIRPESQWKDRCQKLLRTATPFILRGMGVPPNWQTLTLWSSQS